MKYVVLGGLGFLGSETCRQLLRNPKTESVTVYDNDSKGYGESNVIDLLDDSRFKWHHIDLSNDHGHSPDSEYKNGSNATWGDLANQLYGADYVLNFAALIGGIGYFNKIPAEILRDNNLVNTHVMDVLVGLGKRAPHYLYMSSSMVFEGATSFPSAESDLPTTFIPRTAYGFQKLTGEFMCKAYADQYGLNYTIIRPFNAVGPERPDPDFVGYSHVIPDLILKIHNGQGTQDNPLELLGDGSQVRHYTDVREIAEGLLLAMHCADDGTNHDFNVAIEKGHSVLEVARLIYKHMHPDKDLYIMPVKGFAHDVQYRSPNIDKMFNMFGWKAKNTLEDIMPRLIKNVMELVNEKAI